MNEMNDITIVIEADSITYLNRRELREGGADWNKETKCWEIKASDLWNLENDPRSIFRKRKVLKYITIVNQQELATFFTYKKKEEIIEAELSEIRLQKFFQNREKENNARIKETYDIIQKHIAEKGLEKVTLGLKDAVEENPIWVSMLLKGKKALSESEMKTFLQYVN